jgi:hypothetical protein
MAGSKKYFHDRIVLLLLSTNVFFALLATAAILFRLSGAHNSGFIAEYRSNLGLSAFRPGNSLTFVSFIVFVGLVAFFHAFLSRKVYHLSRHFALAVLGLGTMLIVFATIVSNALLGL